LALKTIEQSKDLCPYLLRKDNENNRVWKVRALCVYVCISLIWAKTQNLRNQQLCNWRPVALGSNFHFFLEMRQFSHAQKLKCTERRREY
jgi:hypothetical protein